MTRKKKTNLKKEFWKVFSLYIRHKEKGKCFTCGLQKLPKQMQTGHFISKKICGLGLYFHEMNNHCQCYRCNINLGGNGAIYARKIKEIYGQGALDEIYVLYDKRENFKISDEEYQALIIEYQKRVDDFLK